MASSDNDSDFAGKGRPHGRKPKRKKGAGRGAVACLQCRLSKVACDLEHPACGACTAKGEEGLCSLGNLLWYENPEDAPANKLRAGLDRLEAMVLRIRDTAASQGGASSPRGSFYGSSSNPSSPTCSSPRGTGHRPANRHSDAEILSRLLFTGTVSAHVSPGVDIAATCNALQYSDAATPPEPLPQLAEPNITLSRPSVSTFENVFSIMPTRPQAMQAISVFFERADHLRVVHRPRFDAQCLAFWESGNAPDPHWLATFLCVAGHGLLAMSDDEAARSHMPGGDGRGLLARSWLDGALQALFAGDFLKTPSLEAVRAVVLLNQFWASWQAGQHLVAAISFNTNVVAAAYELDLHREPDELEIQFSPLEAEERRRVFWAFFTLDCVARSFVGKSYAPLDLASITTRRPSQLPDEAFSPSGDFNFSFRPQVGSNAMTSVIALHSTAVVLAKITKLIAGSYRPSGTEIVRLHEELQVEEVASSPALQPTVLLTESLGEASVRAIQQALLSVAFIRLHRSCLGTSLNDMASPDGVWHRAVCLQHCNKLLDSFEHSTSVNAVATAVVHAAVAQAGITLAVDLLDSPIDDATANTQERLAILSSLFAQATGDSARTLRRAATILSHLTIQLDRQHEHASGVPVSTSFFGMSHSHSGSYSTSENSVIDTPPPPSFLLAPGRSQQGTRRTSDHSSDIYFASPLPDDHSLASFADFHSESFYPTNDADNEYDHHPAGQSMLKMSDGGAFAPPLLRPWLAEQYFNPLIRDLFT